MSIFSIPNISPERFIFDHDCQYHVLKHFSVIDDEYLQEMVSKGSHSKRDIVNRMKKFGSKFQAGFLSNPLEAIRLLENEREYVLNYRMKSENRIEMQLIFDMAKNPEGAGWDTLVSKAGFQTDNEIKVRMRNGFPIEYTKGDARPTWELHFIFTRSSFAGATEDKWRLGTLFPGKYAPPFPDKAKQSDSEFEQNASFWNDHLFLTE